VPATCPISRAIRNEQPSDVPDSHGQRAVTSPRSRTDLNGAGCRYRNLRICECAINPGDEGSLTVTHGQPALQVRPDEGPDRADSQALGAGLIPVTCSKQQVTGPRPEYLGQRQLRGGGRIEPGVATALTAPPPAGRGPNRNRSQDVNGRGGRNVCMARLRARCARGAAPAAAARGWADSVGRTLTWQPPRGEAGAVQQACTATPLTAHQASWNNGQTPSGAASSGRRGRSLASRDIRGMILDDVGGGHAESPGKSNGGQ
jgi:hypothetical protein